VAAIPGAGDKSPTPPTATLGGDSGYQQAYNGMPLVLTITCQIASLFVAS
jgi:hypothetical protein